MEEPWGKAIRTTKAEEVTTITGHLRVAVKEDQPLPPALQKKKEHLLEMVQAEEGENIQHSLTVFQSLDIASLW